MVSTQNTTASSLVTKLINLSSTWRRNKLFAFLIIYFPFVLLQLDVLLTLNSIFYNHKNRS